MLVVLDAGHGGHDPGAVGNGFTEKERALTLTKYVDAELKSRGIRTMLTRDNDTFVSLSGRANIANRNKATIFVSFHLNAATPSASGYETFTYTKVDANTKRLQDLLHSNAMAVLNKYGIKDRGKKQANLAVVRETTMPAVLTENGFISNADDMKYIGDNNVLNELGKAYADAIAMYLGVKVASKPKQTVPKQTQIGVATVKVPELNVRQGPGTQYGVVKKVYKGESYKVFAEVNGWLNVGGDQWISNVQGKYCDYTKLGEKPKKTGSLVDYLKSIGVDSSFANRKRLADKHGIKNYRGTAEQNLQLLNKL